MNKKFAALMSIIEIILHSAVFFTGMVVICYEPLGYVPEEYIRCLLVIPAVIFSWFLRRRSISNRKFYICHILLAAAAVIIGRNDIESFLWCVLIFMLALYSSYIMYKSERPDKERPSYFMLAVMLFAFISGNSYDNGIVVYTSAAATVIFVILSVLYDNLYRMQLVFLENRSMSDFPERRLIKVNSCVMLLTVLAMLAAMSAALAIGSDKFPFLGEIGIAIGRAAAVFIIWLIELFGKFQHKAPKRPPVSEQSTQEQIIDYVTEQNVGTIERIINAVIVTAAAIILAGMIILFLRALNRFMRRKHTRLEGNDIIEFVKNEDRKSYVKRKKSKQLLNKAEFSDNEKFRRAYKRLVRKGMKKNGRKKLPVSMTPADITNSNITQDSKTAAIITQAYEMARYSQESVTKEQIDSLKHIDKN